VRGSGFGWIDFGDGFLELVAGDARAPDPGDELGVAGALARRRAGDFLRMVEPVDIGLLQGSGAAVDGDAAVRFEAIELEGDARGAAILEGQA
jgi:hypothetical protein